MIELIRFVLFVFRAIQNASEKGGDTSAAEHSLEELLASATGLDAHQANTDPIAVQQAIEGLQREADKLHVGFERIGPTAKVFLDILDKSVSPKLRTHQQMAQHLSKPVESLNQITERRSVAQHIERSLKETRGYIEVLAGMLEQRSSPLQREMYADADAVAYALIAPLQRHFNVYEIPFPDARPICAPANEDHESIWFGLLPKGYPVIFTPSNFDQDLFRLGSVAHEIGHLLLHRVDGLHRELVQISVPPVRDVLAETPDLSQFLGELYGAWITELFSDMFTMLMLGPAGLRGMTHAFDARGDALQIQRIRFQPDGKPVMHPPADLRVRLATRFLTRMGFDQQVAPIYDAWHRDHDEPDHYLVRLDDGRTAKLPADVVERPGDAMVEAWYGTQIKSIGDYQLETVPGLEMSPGLWARVQRRAETLISGKRFHEDPRIVLAAAIEARARRPGSVKTIREGVRHAIMGRDAWELHADDPAARRPRASRAKGDSVRAMARDALLLHEVLGSRVQTHGERIPHRRRPRTKL